jgi:hypothetical protein
MSGYQVQQPGYEYEQPGYQSGYQPATYQPSPYQQQPSYVIGGPNIIVYPAFFTKHPQNLNW